MIKNVKYVGPHKILNFDIVSGIYHDVCSYEISPAHVVLGKIVIASPDDYIQKEIKDLINKSHATVWTEEIVNSFKKTLEDQVIESYNEKTISDDQFAMILGAVPDIADLLPDRYFFDPNQTFIDKMKELYDGRHIVDCGAGNGHTGKILSNAGFEVTCLDITPYKTYEHPVEIMDVADFKFDDSMVCLICRPDSDEWFQKAVKQALDSKCPVIFVRSKCLFLQGSELIAKNVGADMDFMFQIEA
jgi:hypothetical protein